MVKDQGWWQCYYRSIKDWIEDNCDESNPLDIYDYPPKNNFEHFKSIIYLVANNEYEYEYEYGNPPSPIEWGYC